MGRTYTGLSSQHYYWSQAWLCLKTNILNKIAKNKLNTENKKKESQNRSWASLTTWSVEAWAITAPTRGSNHFIRFRSALPRLAVLLRQIQIFPPPSSGSRA